MNEDKPNKEDYSSQKHKVRKQPQDDGTFDEDESVQVREEHEPLAPSKPPSTTRSLLTLAASFLILLVILVAILFGAPALGCNCEGVKFESIQGPHTPGR